MRVLVVEDDVRLSVALRRGLEEDGFAVDVVGDGDGAVTAAVMTPFDAIILDVMLPGETDGFAVCAQLRRARVRSRVLMLTARDAVDDRVRGLDAGADDYLVKPFAFRELLARLRALVRRHLDDRAAVIDIGSLQVDTSARDARVGGRSLVLTPKEFAILEFFVLHAGQLLTRSQVERAIWNDELAPTSNLVEVYVGRIRRKLVDAGVVDPFVTIRGEGYRFDRQRLCDAFSAGPASA